VRRGLKSFTPHTLTTGAELAAELVKVRRDGYAVDREEFDENFCCIAAPILDEGGRFVAALGLSTTPHVFDTEREELSATVMDVAGAAKPTPRREPARLVAPAPRERLVPVA
jgi:acetyl-CoA synthetase